MNWKLQTANLVTRRHHQRIRFVSNEKFLAVSVVAKMTADKADFLRISTGLAQAQTTATEAAMGENVQAVSAVMRATVAKTDLFRISSELAHGTSSNHRDDGGFIREGPSQQRRGKDESGLGRLPSDQHRPGTTSNRCVVSLFVIVRSYLCSLFYLLFWLCPVLVFFNFFS
jgi:hypothetical protein